MRAKDPLPNSGRRKWAIHLPSISLLFTKQTTRPLLTPRVFHRIADAVRFPSATSGCWAAFSLHDGDAACSAASRRKPSLQSRGFTFVICSNFPFGVSGAPIKSYSSPDVKDIHSFGQLTTVLSGSLPSGWSMRQPNHRAASGVQAAHGRAAHKPVGSEPAAGAERGPERGRVHPAAPAPTPSHLRASFQGPGMPASTPLPTRSS